MTATPTEKQITISVPNSIEKLLLPEEDASALPRWALEGLVAEAVRKHLISEGYAGMILGLSFTEREDFLATHGILHDESLEELLEEQRALDRVLP